MMSTDRLTSIVETLDRSRMPHHVAIIMDGNGRWAKQRGLPRSAGHYKGVDSVREVTRIASILGVKYLTLYAFSTENWRRPKEEVDTLMYLLGHALRKEVPELLANNVKLRLVGDIAGLPEEAREELIDCSNQLAHCTGLNLLLCVNYSSRWELTHAMREMAASVAQGNLDADAVTADTINAHLATYPAPDPDLLIRTGGEQRISNFLLWQISYSELYFTDILWPDFQQPEFAGAILEYQQRERRFGKTSEQINEQTEQNPSNQQI